MSGGEAEYGELSVTKSPADLGKCASIKDLTEMFRMCVKADGNNAADDDDYLSELIETVGELEPMSDIKVITISSELTHGHTDWVDTEVYTYYRDKDITVYAVESSDEDDPDMRVM